MDTSPESVTKRQAFAKGVLPYPANQVGSIDGRFKSPF
jgi:hypothetical protein